METQVQKGQKIEERLKEQLKDISEELTSLRKERTKLFLNKLNRDVSVKKKISQTPINRRSFLKNKHTFSDFFSKNIIQPKKKKSKKFIQMNFKEKYYCKTNYSNKMIPRMNRNLSNYSIFNRRKTSEQNIKRRTKENNLIKKRFGNL